jgi:hypothetical protein
MTEMCVVRIVPVKDIEEGTALLKFIPIGKILFSNYRCYNVHCKCSSAVCSKSYHWTWRCKNDCSVIRGGGWG